jgi:fructose-1,6-bisphosphatase/sedoheptulose 1,7-bisphosphatase-like protein
MSTGSLYRERTLINDVDLAGVSATVEIDQDGDVFANVVIASKYQQVDLDFSPILGSTPEEALGNLITYRDALNEFFALAEEALAEVING